MHIPCLFLSFLFFLPLVASNNQKHFDAWRYYAGDQFAKKLLDDTEIKGYRVNGKNDYAIFPAGAWEGDNIIMGYQAVFSIQDGKWHCYNLIDNRRNKKNYEKTPLASEYAGLIKTIALRKQFLDALKFNIESGEICSGISGENSNGQAFFDVGFVEKQNFPFVRAFHEGGGNEKWHLIWRESWPMCMGGEEFRGEIDNLLKIREGGALKVTSLSELS